MFRQGCCLCDSLKNKLAKINLNELFPNLEELKEIDIDRVDLYKDKYKKYDYEVPVIAIEGIRSEEIIELPRISPRLKDDQLKNWFQKILIPFCRNNFCYMRSIKLHRLLDLVGIIPSLHLIDKEINNISFKL